MGSYNKNDRPQKKLCTRRPKKPSSTGQSPRKTVQRKSRGTEKEHQIVNRTSRPFPPREEEAMDVADTEEKTVLRQVRKKKMY